MGSGDIQREIGSAAMSVGLPAARSTSRSVRMPLSMLPSTTRTDPMCRRTMCRAASTIGVESGRVTISVLMTWRTGAMSARPAGLVVAAAVPRL